jgi:hypothetical protein
MPQTKFIKEPISSHRRVSKYTGVRQVKGEHNWESYFTFNGVKYICGIFSCDKAAAKARDEKILNVGANKPLQILKRA